MEVGNIEVVDIDEQMRSAYLDYAMSVIVARALPDARDGLKPVHRRILYAMHDMGIKASSSYKKSARIVGEVLGKYHPHGDGAVYDSMARMAQDFSMRYMLVDGQGNFGSVDGDSPAAMRYTEARLDKMAEELLTDIEKDTVEWVDNFDGSLQEPDVLPARLPNLLLNGTSGIAVGMATNIPPHNLNELASAIMYLIDREEIITIVTEQGEDAAEMLPEKFGMSEEQARRITKTLLKAQADEAAEQEDVTDNYYGEDIATDTGHGEATVEELMCFVTGPDFPTGGQIVGTEGIVQAYSTGRGRVIMRAVAEIEEVNNRNRIIITEIPYQVNKASLIEKIAELVRSGKLDKISDLRDESDRNGMRIFIELKRGAQPKKVLNQLYKHTMLQTTFGVQLLALVNKEPRLLSLRRALQIHIQHRLEVIRRRAEFELRKAKERAHILEGLLIAIANIDEVIRIIRESQSADAARSALMSSFDLSQPQAQAILDLQLRRLAALERLKIETEYNEIKERIDYLETLLASERMQLELIKGDLGDLMKSYGDTRNSKILYNVSGSLSIEDMIPDEANLISITQRGYIKRMKLKTFKAQGRGGKGVKGASLREEDEVIDMFPCRSLYPILFFTNRGKVYSEKAYEIPESERTSRGISLHNIIPMEQGEYVTAAVPVPDFAAADFATMVTEKGKIKRVSISAFESVRQSGLIAITLEDEDTLKWVRLTLDDQDMILVTRNGRAIRFNSAEVRPMGRNAMGVKAASLKPGDKLTGAEIAHPDRELLVVTENGYGKRTALEEYVRKGRATSGVATISKQHIDVTGKVVDAKVVEIDDMITFISTNGQAMRCKVEDINVYGRATMGTRLMNLKAGDTVASMAKTKAQPEEAAAAEETPEGAAAPADGGDAPAPAEAPAE